MRDLIQQLKEAKGRATIKKLTKAEVSFGDRAKEFRTGAKWGLYWDGKLVAEIVSSSAGYMDPVNWTVQTPDDWQPLKTFYKQDGGVKGAKAWALDNAEFIAALGPKPGPKAQAKLFTLRGYEKVGTVWKKTSGLKEAIVAKLGAK